MRSTSIKLPDTTADPLDEYADEHTGGNRSEAVRELVAKGLRYDSLEAERDRLQRELRATNARQEDVGEVVEYVEGEKQLRERERARRDAPLWKRARWFVFGRS